MLARRKTGGKIEGEILVNGRKPTAKLNRMIGYVEQQDIHTRSQTVKEAIEFSARVSYYYYMILYNYLLLLFINLFYTL